MQKNYFETFHVFVHSEDKSPFNVIHRLNISGIKEKVQELIASNQVPKAIEILIDWVKEHAGDTEHLIEVLVISADFRLFERAFKNGLLSLEEFTRLRRALLFKILTLVNSVANQSESDAVATL